MNEVSSADDIIAKEISIDLKKGDKVAIWSEMDMEYKADANLKFQIKVYNDKNEYRFIEFDPRIKKTILLMK